jgi:hypothetical protein
MTISVEKQYSVFLVNKPGVMAMVAEVLAKSKVNIKALTLVDSQEHGVLRLVLENGEKANAILRSLNIPITETDVLCMELANNPGALADVCDRLAKKHININYAYCTTGSKRGKTLGIFKVSDLAKAKKVLAVRTTIRKTSVIKKSPARKK